MNHDTTDVTDGAGDATLLLDLDGLQVTAVEHAEGGGRVVRLVTVDPDAAACLSCGVFLRRVKEYVCTRPRDVPAGGARLDLRWRKRRWYCREPRCPRGPFTESVGCLPPRAWVAARLHEQAGRLAVDGACASVAAAGRATGPSWPVVIDSSLARVRRRAGRRSMTGAARAAPPWGRDGWWLWT